MRNFIKSKRWAYLAGLMDGDGSINLTEFQSPQQKHFFLNVSVNSSDRTTMNWLVQQFGGSYRREKETRPNMRDQYHWLSKGHSSRRILEEIAKYLILKQEAANKALEYLTVIPFGAENPTLRSQYTKQLNAINRLFVPAINRPVKNLIARPSQLSKEMLAYIAGIIDAEGTFSIPTKTAKSPQIQVSNTDMRILDWMYNIIGGIVFASKKKNQEHRDSGLWRLSGGRNQTREHLIAIKKIKELFLLAILPYLVTKKRQAIVALALIRSDKPSNICFEQMKKLNEIGTPTTNMRNTEESVKIESEPVGNSGNASLVIATA